MGRRRRSGKKSHPASDQDARNATRGILQTGPGVDDVRDREVQNGTIPHGKTRAQTNLLSSHPGCTNAPPKASSTKPTPQADHSRSSDSNNRFEGFHRNESVRCKRSGSSLSSFPIDDSENQTPYRSQSRHWSQTDNISDSSRYQSTSTHDSYYSKDMKRRRKAPVWEPKKPAGLPIPQPCQGAISTVADIGHDSIFSRPPTVSSVDMPTDEATDEATDDATDEATDDATDEATDGRISNDNTHSSSSASVTSSTGSRWRNLQTQGIHGPKDATSLLGYLSNSLIQLQNSVRHFLNPFRHFPKPFRQVPNPLSHFSNPLTHVPNPINAIEPWFCKTVMNPYYSMDSDFHVSTLFIGLIGMQNNIGVRVRNKSRDFQSWMAERIERGIGLVSMWRDIMFSSVSLVENGISLVGRIQSILLEEKVQDAFHWVRTAPTCLGGVPTCLQAVPTCLAENYFKCVRQVALPVHQMDYVVFLVVPVVVSRVKDSFKEAFLETASFMKASVEKVSFLKASFLKVSVEKVCFLKASFLKVPVEKVSFLKASVEKASFSRIAFRTTFLNKVSTISSKCVLLYKYLLSFLIDCPMTATRIREIVFKLGRPQRPEDGNIEVDCDDGENTYVEKDGSDQVFSSFALLLSLLKYVLGAFEGPLSKCAAVVYRAGPSDSSRDADPSDSSRNADGLLDVADLPVGHSVDLPAGHPETSRSSHWALISTLFNWANSVWQSTSSQLVVAATSTMCQQTSFDSELVLALGRS